MINRIQELAIPKGSLVVHFCEICGTRATTKCEECRVTHYCGTEHRAIDAISFHPKVCKALADIRMERPLPTTEEDRIAEQRDIKQKQRDVLKQAQAVTRRWLLEGKPMNAYAPSMITWNMAQAIRNVDERDLIVPACLVSEMFLNGGDIEAAQDYMVQASFISQKFDILPSDILSRLYRIRGLVLMASGNFDQSREAFAEFVYSVAIEHGISNLRMGVPFSLLGLALLKFENVEGAMANFHRMSDFWLGYLLDRYERRIMRVATEKEMAADPEVEETEFQYKELKTVILWIYENVRKLGMEAMTDRINFKVLCLQLLFQMREGQAKKGVIFREEALATATRTKMDKAVPKEKIELLKEVLQDDFILRWEKKNNRPRTVATKYLEQIKALDFMSRKGK